MLHVMRTSRLLLLFVVVTLAVQGCLCCVTPTGDPHDPWASVSSASPTAPRLRREVTLMERVHCDRGDPQPPNRVDTRNRVASLVKEMESRGLDAYIIPSADEHQSEYVAPADERRAYISGFTGSAGTAVVMLAGERALWTDGRYFLSADDQMDCEWLLMKSKQEGVPTMLEWLQENLNPGSRVGVDPAVVSAGSFIEYKEKLNESRITLEPESNNLVDLVWPVTDRPIRGNDPVYVLEEKYTGLNWTQKVLQVRAEMRKEKVDLLVVTAMDEVAWLLNLRGNDVPYNPVFRSYVILGFSEVILFLDNSRITPVVDYHLQNSRCITADICLQVTGYDNLVPRLESASANASVSKVLLPKKYGYSGGASYAVFSAVPEVKRHVAVSPVLTLKARKNPVEFAGMKNAHVKDAVALVDFLAFLEKEIEAGNDWDEVKAADKLEQFRSEQEDYVSPSFETISGFGSNGAIIHYRPTPETSKKITKDSLYLLDSGGQYKDGTTDVTRTMHYGEPTAMQKEAYTRVLLGSLDLAMLVFPKGTGDSSIDVLARRYLYQVGLNYLHGTGHGIGMFLNIHESPTQIRIYADENHDFELGQFFSDEPGYYKDGEFGVRLETILAVVKAETKYNTGEVFYGFELITLVPFEAKLIEMSMFTMDQCEYLNNYHATVKAVVGGALRAQGRMEGLEYLNRHTQLFQCSASGNFLSQATVATMGSHRASSAPSWPLSLPLLLGSVLLLL